MRRGGGGIAKRLAPLPFPNTIFGQSGTPFNYMRKVYLFQKLLARVELANESNFSFKIFLLFVLYLRNL